MFNIGQSYELLMGTEKDLLHSEVIGSQAGVVNLEHQAGIVTSGVEHLFP